MSSESSPAQKMKGHCAGFGRCLEQLDAVLWIPCFLWFGRAMVQAPLSKLFAMTILWISLVPS